MKVGIVVPFSWSYWGGVVEHAENQAASLRARGHDVSIVMGHDPPGRATRLLHPRTGRHGDLPSGIIPVGRSVVVPANGSLPNIVLSPRAIGRVRETLERERFDVLHLHEPMTTGDLRRTTLAFAKCPVIATWHAAGELGWMRGAVQAWGFLIDRIDQRIAVSRMAAESAERWLGPGFEIVPNGVVVPERYDPGGREHRIVFIGPPRHPEGPARPPPCAWPSIHRETGCQAQPDRDRPAPVPAAPLPDALRRGGDRRARDRDQRGCARAGGRPRRRSSSSPAPRRPRALRDGAHRGIRDDCHARRRLEHPRLRGRLRVPGAGNASSSRATPRPSRRPSSRSSPTRASGSRWA